MRFLQEISVRVFARLVVPGHVYVVPRLADFYLVPDVGTVSVHRVLEREGVTHAYCFSFYQRAVRVVAVLAACFVGSDLEIGRASCRERV